MPLSKRALAEFIGTFWLVFGGCGSAVLAAAFPVLPTGAADWLLRVTPAAGFAIKQVIPAYPQVTGGYTPFGDYFPLAPWAGFAVTCAWAALALVLAAFLLRRRDA